MYFDHWVTKLCYKTTLNLCVTKELTLHVFDQLGH